MYMYMYVYIIYSIVQSSPTGRPKSRTLRCPLGRPFGLPALPAGPAWASALLSWASVPPVLAFRTPVGRELDAKGAPSWTAKTGASVNIRLEDPKSAAKCKGVLPASF